MALELSQSNIIKCSNWFKSNFGLRAGEAVKGTPFTVNDLAAISCQETSYIYLNWINKYDTATILKYLIADYSGDVSGSSRSAFPKKTSDFINVYGQDYTNKIIVISQQAQKMRIAAGANISVTNYIPRGYGIFQYDLQFILKDKTFWDNQLWSTIEGCLNRVMLELNQNYNSSKDVRKSIRMYNGSGTAAETYATNVTQMSTIISGSPYTYNIQKSVTYQPDIKPVQRILKVKDDGFFGDNTLRALNAYQQTNQLAVTGVIDNATVQKMGFM